MRALAVYHTPDGGSKLIDIDLPQVEPGVGPDGARVWLGSKGARSWGVAHGDGGASKDWHRGSSASLSVVVEGGWEIETTDGDRRDLGLGSVLLVMDTEGQGHRSRVTGSSCKTLGIGLTDEARDDIWALIEAAAAEAGRP